MGTECSDIGIRCVFLVTMAYERILSERLTTRDLRCIMGVLRCIGIYKNFTGGMGRDETLLNLYPDV